jgi:Flp pilus assembly protein TadG
MGECMRGRNLRDLAGDRSGAIIVKFALFSPILFAAVAAAVDYSSLEARRTEFQAAADSAALASVRELSLANHDASGVQSVAQSVVMAKLRRPGAAVVAARQTSDTSVQVVVSERITNAMGRILNHPQTDVRARAVARISATKICMVALEPQKPNALWLNNNSRLTAQACSVFSDSINKSGIKAGDNAQVVADLVCSSGGVSGKKGHFSNPPVTDCPPVPDPLAARNPPAVGACDFTKVEIKGGVQTLTPGVYCGGLKITQNAAVSLMPGIYIVQGGKFTVDHGASLEGKDVGFYLAGKDSSFELGYDSIISLAAPKTGELAGLLFFDDRAGKWDKHKIFSNEARVLLGTIYLPNGSLYIDAQKPIADKSAYTVVVARTIELYDGPNLVLNSNYDGTTVPVPKGLGPVGSSVTLVR